MPSVSATPRPILRASHDLAAIESTNSRAAATTGRTVGQTAGGHSRTLTGNVIAHPATPSTCEPAPPARIQTAATQAGLGEHQRCFGPVATEPTGWLIALTAGFGALAALLFSAGQSAALLPAAVLIVSAIATVWRAARNRDSRAARLDLFEKGVTLAGGAAVQLVRYSDTVVLQDVVHHSASGQHGRSTHRYILEDIDGAAVTLYASTGRRAAGLPCPDQWGPAIQRAVTAAQLPAAWAAVAAGKRLVFGEFWITKHQLGSGDDTWYWSQVHQIRVRNGVVQLKSGNSWAAVADSHDGRIPNYFVFLTLAEQLVAQSPKSH